ncbi:MAG TPA: TonB-dependent receptor [Gemmatimonadaceae bacterium]|nr:TonB-dependent receptor [Gemmatimonadaceae bacterium]
MRSAVCILVAGLLAVSPLPTGAQGVVAGRVVVHGSAVPAAAARVGVIGGDRITATGADGEFALRAVPAGRHTLHIALIGFAPARAVVNVPVAGPLRADTVRVLIELLPAAVTLDGIQVTATPTGRDPLSVAQSTSTLGGRDLERSISTSLGATLQSQPGLAARYDGPGASAPIIRGLSGDRVLILQDGQRTGDVASTAPDHGVTIDPASAGRVEIVRGPASLLYGNNAVGGVINVISDDIPLTLPTRAFGSLTVTGESASPGGGGQMELVSPVGSRGALRVRAGARTHGDVRVAPGFGAATLPNTYMRNAHGVIGGALIGDRQSIGAAYRGYGFDYGLPVPLNALDQAVTIEGSRHELLLHGETKAPGWLEGVRVEANAQWYHHDELDVEGRIGTALELRSQHVRALARTRAIGPFRDGAIGVSALLRQNGVSGASALTPANAGWGAGVFVFQEIPLACLARSERCAIAVDGLERELRVPVGIRYDRYVIESRESEAFGPAMRRELGGISASVGVTVPLIEGASVGGTVARAFRSPTAEELYSRAGHTGTGAFEIGDPLLGAETNTGLDLVLRVARPSMTAQLSAYASRIDGYIALHPTGRDTVLADARRYPLYVVAQRDVRMRGAEASIERAVTARVVLGAMGDVVHARDATGGPLPFMPPARLGVSARWEARALAIGGGVRHAFAQRTVPGGESPTPDYTVADLHASLRLVQSSRAHTLTVRVENAANVLYRDAASRIKDFAPNPGRSTVLVYRLMF